MQDLRASRAPSGVPTTLGFGSPSFPRSAWDTAGRTGALALMDYAEVKRFSEIYDLQDVVDRVQERYVDRLTQQSAQFMAAVAEYAPGVRPDDPELAEPR